MRSGKSSELYAAGRRALAANQRVLVIGHKTNTRDTATGLVTRDGHLLPEGDRVDHLVVTKLEGNAWVEKLVERANTILVEEGQFFDADDLTGACLAWRAQRKRVHIAALSGDFCRKPWPAVTRLLPLANDLQLHKGVCQYCYRDAEFTCAKQELKPGVPHPGDGAFCTVCNDCYALYAVLPASN